MAEGNVARKESTRWAAPNTRYDGDDWGNEYEEDSNDSFDNSGQLSPQATDHMDPIRESSSPLVSGNSTRVISQSSRDALPLFSHRETSEVPSDGISKITLREPEPIPAPTEIYNPYNTHQSTKSPEPLPETANNFTENGNEGPQHEENVESTAFSVRNDVSNDGSTTRNVENVGNTGSNGKIETDGTGDVTNETGGENETIIRDIYGFYENRYTQNFSADPQVLSRIGANLNEHSTVSPEHDNDFVENEAEESHNDGLPQAESSDLSDYMAHHQVSSQKKHPYSLDNDISNEEFEEEVVGEGETERTETPMYSFTTDPSQSMHSEMGDSTNASGSQWPNDTSLTSERKQDNIQNAPKDMYQDVYGEKETSNDIKNENDDASEHANEAANEKDDKSIESKSAAFTQPLNQFNHIGYVDSAPIDMEDNESSDDDQLSEMDAFSEERVLDDEIAELYHGSSKFLKRPISTYQDPGPLTQNISDKSLKKILDPDTPTDGENNILENLDETEVEEIEPLKTAEIEPLKATIEPLSLHPTTTIPEQPTATVEPSNTFVLPSELSRLEASKATDLDFDRLDSESVASFLSGTELQDNSEIISNNNTNNRESVNSSVVSDFHGSSISQSESNDNSHLDDDEVGSRNIRDQDASSDMGSNMDKQSGITPLSASKRIKRPPHIDFAALFNTPGSSSESRAEQMRLLRVRENDYSTGLETWILSTYSQVDPAMKVYPDGVPPEATGLDMDTAAKISNAVYTSTTTTKEKLLNVGEKSKSLGTKSKSFFAKVIR